MLRRPLLALATLAVLLLNGSMALATMPSPCAPPGAGVCEISLRMMAPPPPRPLTQAALVAAACDAAN